MTQPPPQPNNSTPIVDLLIEELQQRKQLGIERYGVPLQAHNGRDALRDALDEALDLVIYLRQAIEERDKPISIEQEIAMSESNFSDIPSIQLRKMRARGAVEEKIKRSFFAICKHNDTSLSNNYRWFIGNQTLRQLSGCNGQIVAKWIEEHQEIVDYQNDKHNLSQYHNKRHRLSICEVIEW